MSLNRLSSTLSVIPTAITVASLFSCSASDSRSRSNTVGRPSVITMAKLSTPGLSPLALLKHWFLVICSASAVFVVPPIYWIPRTAFLNADFSKYSVKGKVNKALFENLTTPTLVSCSPIVNAFIISFTKVSIVIQLSRDLSGGLASRILPDESITKQTSACVKHSEISNIMVRVRAYP